MNSSVVGDSPTGDNVMKNSWVEQLFQNSPLKKEKFSQLKRLLPKSLAGLSLLDIGGDNGVISYKLRELGGEWSSVDLIDEAVVSIRKVVEERVFKMEPAALPFEDASFDCVAVVDMLEHLPQDKPFIEEVTRVLKADGIVLLNVPNPKEGLLRAFRNAIGQTDEKHGHVRPGYTEEQLRDLLGAQFTVIESSSYSRLFAQLIDTFVNGGLSLLKAGKKGKKGTLVTADTFEKSKKKQLMLRLIGPILSFAILLDKLFPFTHGGMLIVKAVKRPV